MVDVTLSTLGFRSGVTAHIFVSWLHPSKEQRLVVVGTDQMAVFDDTAAQKLQLYPHRVDWSDRAPRAVKAEAGPRRDRPGRAAQGRMLHFLRCVAERSKPLTDGREGLRVLRVLDACQKSIERQAGRCQPLAPEPTPYFAHATACVDQPCVIGPGTRIWHFSHVMKGARIGSNCTIGQNVVIASTVVIGDGVKIQNNVSIYDGVVLEDGVFCGPSMVFTNVLNPRSEIVRKNEYRPTLVRRGGHPGSQLHDRLRPHGGTVRVRGGRAPW